MADCLKKPHDEAAAALPHQSDMLPYKKKHGHLQKN
jgi:hypothetical protein